MPFGKLNVDYKYIFHMTLWLIVSTICIHDLVFWILNIWALLFVIVDLLQIVVILYIF